ncbi:hypothetical protein LIER_26085 [Lithospermum erythrorhizon]|uniref:DUF4283 domain-containing protein n=1 Tax=Lithospermum erythrorhizon TaxID=34254 RepID=A0AAV3RAT7_LITER
MKMDMSCIAAFLIWIRLLGLGLEHWNMEMFSEIGSIVGKPLFPDFATAEMTRLSYARICVKVTVKSDMSRQVKLKDDQMRELEVVLDGREGLAEIGGEESKRGGYDNGSVKQIVVVQSPQVSPVVCKMDGRYVSWCDDDLANDAEVNGINDDVLFPESILPGVQVRNAYACLEKVSKGDKPWIWTLDFKCVLSMEEASSGGAPNHYAMADFKKCVDKLDMEDLAPAMSNHSAMDINIEKEVLKYGRSFKFHEFWCNHPEYEEILKKA